MSNPVNESSHIGHGTGCSCCNGHHNEVSNEISRRKFVQVTGTSALGAVAMSGLSWSALASIQTSEKNEIRRRALVVKPIFIYEIPTRRDKSSWRSWGGIQTEQDAEKELVQIQDELKALRSKADFPLEFLPVSRASNLQDLNSIGDMKTVDVILTYSAGRQLEIHDALGKMGKDMIIFARHKSGPVYQTYESMSNNFLRRKTDKLAIDYADEDDIVIDSQDEILWRLRALCGLQNTLYSRILTIGEPNGWGRGYSKEIKNMVDSKYKLDIKTISYEELGNLIKEAKSNNKLVNQAQKRADEYLKDAKISLETKRQFVDNAFILVEIFQRIMDKFNCRAITVNSCMNAIMPIAETSACLTLSFLNDEGYLAFCESDFVVIPAGILLANISGKPSFLNDPTYPHDGMITLAHCTAPRRMDGQKLEPARILTHFESDYGAAPKVEMRVGQTVSNIISNFGGDHYIGLLGKIEDNPFMDICRSQIDISYDCDSKLMQKQMHGFHWITTYGDYMQEIGYALKKIGIEFSNINIKS